MGLYAVTSEAGCSERGRGRLGSTRLATLPRYTRVKLWLEDNEMEYLKFLIYTVAVFVLAVAALWAITALS